MKTFREFLSEGKKKKEEKYIKKLAKKIGKDIKRQRKEQLAAGKIPIINYPHSEPNSPESKAAIMAFLKDKRKWMDKLKKQREKSLQQLRDNPEQFRRDNPDYPNYPQS